jgi:GT2 family glycosyltransferase
MNESRITFANAPAPGLVSVILPTYNRATIVTRAIDSILAQTYPLIEAIVIDDGSTDDTQDVLRRYDERVRVLHQKNSGVGAARNFGITHARGEFIAFLDSDDFWRDWKVEAEVAALQRHPEAGLAWTDMSAEDATGKIVHERYLRQMYGAYHHHHIDLDSIMTRVGTLADFLPAAPAALANAPVRIGDLSSHILLGNLLHTPTVLFRRKWAEQAGGLDPTWVNGGDYEYYTRLCALGPVMIIDAPSIVYHTGAEDQLTAPSKMLSMARNDLRTVRARFSEPGRLSKLPRSALRNRLSLSLGWVGGVEFELGHRGEAARYLAASLRVRPALDRRLLLLGLCALPAAAIDGLRALRRATKRRRRAA